MEGKIVSALSQADTELSKFVEQQSVLSVRVEEEVSIDNSSRFLRKVLQQEDFLCIFYVCV